MRFLDEYRRPEPVRRLAALIRAATTRTWTLMEVCGGQTHSIVRFGLDALLPPEITLVHGPGCPVCVTPLERIEQALELAGRPEILFCSFGDMLRVPGSREDLQSVRSRGGSVQIVYSPLDAVTLARQQPDRQVVFFAVGFETTAPATAAAVLQARHFGLRNFSVLVAHVRVPPAMELLLSGSECRIQGFLAAGHVCAVMGCAEYEVISRRRRVPIVVTGFEPVDLLEGILLCVRQLEAGRAEVENAYARSVRAGGNSAACALVDKVFEVVPMAWRGLGEIPESGLGLRSEFAAFDAELRFRPEVRMAGEPPECRSGLVLQGLIKPEECPAFGGLCTPERPLGAPMVSSEGACAAYYRYRGAPAAEG